MKMVMATVAGMTLLTGCNFTDPCAGLPAPTEAEKAAALVPGVELEREINNTDCQLINGTWQRETN